MKPKHPGSECRCPEPAPLIPPYGSRVPSSLAQRPAVLPRLCCPCAGPALCSLLTPVARTLRPQGPGPSCTQRSTRPRIHRPHPPDPWRLRGGSSGFSRPPSPGAPAGAGRHPSALHLGSFACFRWTAVCLLARLPPAGRCILLGHHIRAARLVVQR